ncbi:MAG: glycine--tRNA ligase subunit beta [Pseudomonadota bacterium]
MPDLLIELLSEEIPARMQKKAAADLERLVLKGLTEAGLSHGAAEAHATPRRLCLWVADVPAESPAKREERKGPRVDAPEKALEGFLRSTGLERDALEARETPKGAVWFATIESPGRPAGDIMAEVLAAAIRDFPWPKSMRWGAASASDGSLRWVRPLQGMLCILSVGSTAEAVEFEIDGIASGTSTVGHRFMAPGRIDVSDFKEYRASLLNQYVVLSAEERAEKIWADVTAGAAAKGLNAVEDKGLLAEVAGLVEWPVTLIGEIDAEFLDLPAAVLRTSMKEHQKFFSLADRDDRITGFATVANIEAPDGGKTILGGNQKVLSARLADAKFFWENDLRVAEGGLNPWREALKSVTFHRKLGSEADRIARIAALAREIAPKVGADPERAATAAELAKADLASEMVYEFPELQGVMGEFYVGVTEAADIAQVAREHYQPLGPSSDVPSAPLSVAVALADKLDTLTGFWAIDERPTGSKDPFALRRAALGVIRLILENELSLPLLPVFETANRIAARDQGADPGALLAFLHDRLKVHFRDRGIRHDVIDASLGVTGSDDLDLLQKRAVSLDTMLQTDDGVNLVQGFRRANNILTQAEENDGVEYSYGAEAKLAEGPEEKQLFSAIDGARQEIDKALTGEDFPAAMAAMARLRAPIDAFFETVQVNADSPIIRRNRLNLLSDIVRTCRGVADLTRLEG